MIFYVLLFDEILGRARLSYLISLTKLGIRLDLTSCPVENFRCPLFSKFFNLHIDAKESSRTCTFIIGLMPTWQSIYMHNIYYRTLLTYRPSLAVSRRGVVIFLILNILKTDSYNTIIICRLFKSYHHTEFHMLVH